MYEINPHIKLGSSSSPTNYTLNNQGPFFSHLDREVDTRFPNLVLRGGLKTATLPTVFDGDPTVLLVTSLWRRRLQWPKRGFRDPDDVTADDVVVVAFLGAALDLPRTLEDRGKMVRCLGFGLDCLINKE